VKQIAPNIREWLNFLFSLKKVRERYGQLETLIGSLGTKLSQVTSTHEKEFLSAYRVHMLNVQQELKELKAK